MANRFAIIKHRLPFFQPPVTISSPFFQTSLFACHFSSLHPSLIPKPMPRVWGFVKGKHFTCRHQFLSTFAIKQIIPTLSGWRQLLYILQLCSLSIGTEVSCLALLVIVGFTYQMEVCCQVDWVLVSLA